MDDNFIPQNDQYFKFVGNYRGIVVANEDPRDIGRIKIYVPGVYPNIETITDKLDDTNLREYINSLPWAEPALGLSFTGGSNTPAKGSDVLKTGFNKTGTGGVFSVPTIGNHVYVWFDQGNHMYPIYFATAPVEDDWLKQKLEVKGIIDDKIKQILDFNSKFRPELGENGVRGTDYGDGAYVNARQKVQTDGETINGQSSANFQKGKATKEFNLIGDGDYQTVNIHNSNKNSIDEKIASANTGVPRARRNLPTFDIKPLFDKEINPISKIGDVTKDNPHNYPSDWKVDEVDLTDNYKRNLNRYITTIKTGSGTTIVIDNRPDQENYYLIHKGYMFNIDEHGSVKEFVGKNTIKGVDVSCDKELGVQGDNKIHVLGNFVTYVRGNEFKQVDSNLQVDVNNSYGIRVKKGDYDIIIEGSSDNSRDGTTKEPAKDNQMGDMNIDIKNGQLEVHVKKNVNMHVEGDMNLTVDGAYSIAAGSYNLVTTAGDITNTALGGIFDSAYGNVSSESLRGSITLKLASSDASVVFSGDNVRIDSNLEVLNVVQGGGCRLEGGNIHSSLTPKFDKWLASYESHNHHSPKGDTSPPIKPSGISAYNKNILSAVKAPIPTSSLTTPDTLKVAVRETKRVPII